MVKTDITKKGSNHCKLALCVYCLLNALVVCGNFIVVNGKSIQTILNLSKGPWACIVEKYNSWIWLKQPQQKMRSKKLKKTMVCENWMIVNEKMIQTILNLSKGPLAYKIEKYIVWMW